MSPHGDTRGPQTEATREEEEEEAGGGGGGDERRDSNRLVGVEEGDPQKFLEGKLNMDY